MNYWDEVQRGIKAAYHEGGYYARSFATLRATFEPLESEIRTIARSSALPDGDGVNMPTQLWAENWLQRFEAAIKP